MKKYLLIGMLFFCFGGPMHTALAASPSNAACQQSSVYLPKNIDMAKVRSTWLSWYNQARKGAGLAPYSYDPILNGTAIDWSDYAEKKGSISHKRPGQKSYYDYQRILAWFSSLGVSFTKKVGPSAFVENVGWDYYKCSQKDCTNELITAIHHTYAFFIGEKNRKYRPHYDSIMDKFYKKIGLGIAIDPVKKRYYLTVHYATAVTAKTSACLQSA